MRERQLTAAGRGEEEELSVFSERQIRHAIRGVFSRWRDIFTRLGVRKKADPARPLNIQTALLGPANLLDYSWDYFIWKCLARLFKIWMLFNEFLGTEIWILNSVFYWRPGRDAIKGLEIGGIRRYWHEERWNVREQETNSITYFFFILLREPRI